MLKSNQQIDIFTFASNSIWKREINRGTFTHAAIKFVRRIPYRVQNPIGAIIIVETIYSPGRVVIFGSHYIKQINQ